ncbi:MAG: hypothetical protein II384_02435, partial [Prevotella sp.]|nr:hypothetical protein [Prevotella sp.]
FGSLVANVYHRNGLLVIIVSTSANLLKINCYPQFFGKRSCRKMTFCLLRGIRRPPSIPQKEAPSVPPRGGRVSLGLIGLMGLIGLICLIVEPFGSPNGGGDICSLFIVHYSLTNMAHITHQYGPYYRPIWAILVCGSSQRSVSERGGLSFKKYKKVG